MNFEKSTPQMMSRAELRRYEWLKAEKEKAKQQKEPETLVTAANRGSLWTEERKTMKESELRTLVRFIIREVHNVIDETSSTASTGGQVDIPKAFAKKKKFIPDTTFEPYAKPKKALKEIRSIIRRILNEAELKPGQSYKPERAATKLRAKEYPHEEEGSKHKIRNLDAVLRSNMNPVSQREDGVWLNKHGHPVHEPREKFAPGTGKTATLPGNEKAATMTAAALAQRDAEHLLAKKAHKTGLKRAERQRKAQSPEELKKRAAAKAATAARRAMRKTDKSNPPQI